MYKICIKYANEYAEYVNEFAKNMQNMQNMQTHFPICRMCVKPNYAKHVVYAKYATNMQINICCGLEFQPT
jgi:hypothetical protein